MINLGKPSGITLKEHTQHVIDEAKYILKEHSFLIKKYFDLTEKDLEKELLKAARCHDWGKAHKQWQNACQLDHQVYKNWRIKNGLAPEEINPVEYRQFTSEVESAGLNLRGAKLRHELASLEIAARNRVELSDEVKAAIAAHHGKLSFRHKHRWEKDGGGDFYKHWKYLYRLSYHSKKIDKDDLVLKRYQFAAIRALLQLADTRASRKEGEGEEASYKFIPFKIKNKYKELRPVQEAAKELANEWISILRAPTGSGKTYASLLWGDKQINELGRADRLVIAMPTRFTSNALSISVADQIDETGLYHSSAWFNRYGNITEREAKKKAAEAHRMARYLATPVSVCTIDHLLISLSGTKEQHHSTFFFLANSAVVFDEADFYDPFVQANIVELLKVLKVLKVPVLIMSATVPDSARTLYGINAPIKLPNNLPLRHEKKLEWIDEKINELTEEKVLTKMLASGNGIIYANTVASALGYFRKLENRAKEKGIPLVIYHSRFTEPDKKDIEEKLIKLLGQKAWRNHKQIPVKGIAIMTQIGEMSVNISSTLMLSELCPWDRLAQRIGRLVRFEEEAIEKQVGLCYVIEPIKDGALYPAPYGEYNLKEKRWQAYQVLTDTKNDLQQKFTEKNEITPNDFEVFVNAIYPSAPEILGHAKTNQKNYQELIIDNWLILPDMRVDEDETKVAERWTSRFIPPQQTIFISFKPRFSSYNELQEFALEFGISCPVYQIEKELRKGAESKINIDKMYINKNEDEIPIYYIHEDDYDSEMGLFFLYE